MSTNEYLASLGDNEIPTIMTKRTPVINWDYNSLAASGGYTATVPLSETAPGRKSMPVADMLARAKKAHENHKK